MQRHNDRMLSSSPTCGGSSQLERSENLKENTRSAFTRALNIAIDRPIQFHGGEAPGSEAQSLLLDEDSKRHSRSASLDTADGLREKLQAQDLRKSRFVREREQRINKRRKSHEKGPKIIITPAKDDMEKGSSYQHSDQKSNGDGYFPEILMTPKASSSPISRMLRKKSAKKDTLTITTEGIRNRQSLTRQMSQRIMKSESGRLVSIMAKQALFGRSSEVSKTFMLALKKVNGQVLNKVSLEHKKRNKRRLIRWYFKRGRIILGSLFDSWKPDSLPILIWKTTLLLLIIIQSVVSTYILSFMPDDEFNLSNPVLIFDMAIDFVYAIDILMNFKIAFYRHGELCLDRAEIATHYLRSRFALDIISEISLIGRFSEHFKALILLDLLRMLRVPHLVAKVEDYFQFSRQVSSVFQLFKLISALVIFAHWCGCILYYVAISDTVNPVNWITEAGLHIDDLKEIYVASLYWSIATMATIGYGDIHPTTYKERILSIVIMLCSSVIFGYILSSIGTLLIEINAFNSDAREKMRMLTMYMQEKGLSKDIQSKIRRYLEFYLNKENAMKAKGDSILQLLSTNLKEEIIKEVNAKILDDTFMFSSNFRRKFLYLISKDLVEKSLTPDEIVFAQGETDDCSIYFITSGNAEIFYDKCIVNVQKLSKGDNFGAIAFFSGNERTASVKSIEFTTVFQLKRDKFLGKLENFPSEKETYCMIKDNINIGGNFQYLNLRCYSCGSLTHITLNCHKFHAVFRKDQIITDYLEDYKYFRHDFKRRNRPRFHYLRDTDAMHEAASQIQIMQQNELYHESIITDRVQYYSEGEEILDRNIYNPQPILYNVEAVQTKALNIAKQTRTTSSICLSGRLMEKSRVKPMIEIGAVKSFVMASYDPYCHNLSLDQVKNFEVYYPNNNISKLSVGMEKIRMEKMIEMRLQGRAKHIYPLLVKMTERRRDSAIFQSQNSSTSIVNSPTSDNKSVSKNLPGINPSDITFYSSAKKNSIDFGHHSLSNPDFLSVLKVDRKPQTVGTIMGKSNGSLATLGAFGNPTEQRRRSSRFGDNIKLSLFAIEQEEPHRERNTSVAYTLQEAGSKLRVETEENHDLSNALEHSDVSSDNDSDTHIVSSVNYRVGESKDSFGLSKTPTTPQVYSAFSSAGLRGDVLKRDIKAQGSLKTFDVKGTSRGTMSRENSMPRVVNKSGSASQVKTFDIDDSGMFDFSKNMKKLSRKLEENHNSPAFKKGGETEEVSSKKEKIATDDLISVMLKERNRRLRSTQKIRSTSEDTNQHDVKKIIEEYGIHDIIKQSLPKHS